MPIYSYLCDKKKCGVISEVIQSMSEEPITKCPKCKKGAVTKIMSLTARPVVPGDPYEQMAKVKQEAKQIAQKIKNGDQKAAEDIFGDGTQKAKPTTKPKTSKKGNFSRSK